MTSAELCQAAGITYRQLDYWDTVGYLDGPIKRIGSGHPRVWSDADAVVAKLIGRLVKAGIVLPVAARVAHELTGTDYTTTEIGAGIIIYIDKGNDGETWLTNSPHPLIVESDSVGPGPG